LNSVPLLLFGEKGLGDEGKRAKLGYSHHVPLFENFLLIIDL